VCDVGRQIRMEESKVLVIQYHRDLRTTIMGSNPILLSRLDRCDSELNTSPRRVCTTNTLIGAVSLFNQSID
jgi:hypothetical protein